MSEPIKSALTAEEWEQRETAYAALDAGGALIIGSSDKPEIIPLDEDRHGIAALALYGQQFGFTREDVEFLRECCYELTDEIEKANSLADRIESLLPPE